MSIKKTLFMKATQCLSEEYAMRLETLARSMLLVNEFGQFCEKYSLSAYVYPNDAGTVRLIASVGQNMDHEALFARLKQDDYLFITGQPESAGITGMWRISSTVKRGEFNCELHHYLHDRIENRDVVTH